MAKFDLGKLTEKAKDFVDKSGDKIASGVDKVTDKVDEKTKGKYRDKLQKVDAAAAKLDKRNTKQTVTPPAAPEQVEPTEPKDFPEPS